MKKKSVYIVVVRIGRVVQAFQFNTKKDRDGFMKEVKKKGIEYSYSESKC